MSLDGGSLTEIPDLDIWGARNLGDHHDAGVLDEHRGGSHGEHRGERSYDEHRGDSYGEERGEMFGMHDREIDHEPESSRPVNLQQFAITDPQEEMSVAHVGPQRRLAEGESATTGAQRGAEIADVGTFWTTNVWLCFIDE